ncbi:acyl-CoA thioesterase [Clostridium grantii]|uniref:Acyl-CoA thioester hydrolase n=1 Tax=Clostridium grantii DSM 8605 TaxID=1121316 RepID=A0A1M5TFA1_9CLOT|nr:thioesterase family protein [Clostridium grantii]SHH49437.1 acyl-CoA thioester hydrolase [Clostridium grantii DSM 8605]
MYINKTKIKVRYAETDQMGIVHHSNYYIWFEVGRTEFTKKCGMSYSDIEKENIMMPVLETGCKHMEGAKYEDELIIETWINQLSGAKIIFNYNIIRELDNKLLATGFTKQTFIDNNFKIINLKKKHPELFEKMVALNV